MLLVNPHYRGRLDATARKLIQEGKRVGIIWTNGETADIQCHVCEKISPKPELDATHNDVMWVCPGCQTPFVVTDITNNK